MRYHRSSMLLKNISFVKLIWDQSLDRYYVEMISRFLMNRIARCKAREKMSRVIETSISFSSGKSKDRIYELCSLNGINDSISLSDASAIISTHLSDSDINDLSSRNFAWAFHYPQIKLCIKCLWQSRTKRIIDIDQWTIAKRK